MTVSADAVTCKQRIRFDRKPQAQMELDLIGETWRPPSKVAASRGRDTAKMASGRASRNSSRSGKTNLSASASASVLATSRSTAPTERSTLCKRWRLNISAIKNFNTDTLSNLRVPSSPIRLVLRQLSAAAPDYRQRERAKSCARAVAKERTRS